MTDNFFTKNISRRFVQIVGFYFIIEGIGSLVYLEGEPIFQIGRVLRIAVGIILVFYIADKVK